MSAFSNSSHATKLSIRHYDGPITMTVSQVGRSYLTLCYSDPLVAVNLLRIPLGYVFKPEIDSLVGNNPALYILAGAPQKNGLIDIYVGETGGTAQRVSQQAGAEKNKFAATLYVFTSPNSTIINKTHMRFIEAEITTQLRGHLGLRVKNNFQKMPRMSAYDESLINRCLYTLRKLLVCSGFPFSPETVVDSLWTSEREEQLRRSQNALNQGRMAKVIKHFPAEQKLRFLPGTTSGIGAQAFGQLEWDGSFTIFAGAQLSRRLIDKTERTKNEVELIRQSAPDKDGYTTRDASLYSLQVATSALCGAAVTQAHARWEIVAAKINFGGHSENSTDDHNADDFDDNDDDVDNEDEAGEYESAGSIASNGSKGPAVRPTKDAVLTAEIPRIDKTARPNSGAQL